MQKRALLVHGWEGYPEEGWFPWLKAQLEQRGFLVRVPQLPHAEAPIIGEWLDRLEKDFGEPTEQDILIGHSLGCQAIIRYLAGLQWDKHTAAMICVAGFFELVPLPADDQMIFQPWYDEPIDYGTVKKRSGRIIALFSDNDPWVPVENERLFRECLGAQTQILHNRGHFSGREGTTKLPELLEAMSELL